MAGLDLAQPQLGVKVSSLTLSDREARASTDEAKSSSPIDGQILCVHFPDGNVEQIHDVWSRGDDLVAVYPTTAHRAVRPEIYWRRIAADGQHACGVELIVSVQTDLLGTSAALHVSTQLVVDDVLWIPSPDHPTEFQVIQSGEAEPFAVEREKGEGLFLFRLPGGAITYVESIFPSDFGSAVIYREGSRGRPARVVLRSRLFPESLEKGVIRRARIRGVFLPRENDGAAASRIYQEFAASPLPLTT